MIKIHRLISSNSKPVFSFFRLSDASGRMEFELIAEGDLSPSQLDSNVRCHIGLDLDQSAC